MPSICKTLAFDQAAIKFASGGAQGIFEGYASVFNVVDGDGDIILPGAFAQALKTQTRAVAMFFNHRRNEIPVGKWLDLSEDSVGLHVRGELTPGNPQSEALKAAMIHGTVGGMSVGFSAAKADVEQIATGYSFKNATRLSEISICTFPANEQAMVSTLKSMDGIESIRDAETWLRDSAGLSKSEAQALIARIKSAVRSDSEGGEITAILDRIKSFPSVGK
ncbi:HK97 family phage prohead protease [Pseudomonas syringae]|uniref:HK97 family phage prohead protease n=1 Tax=Pseudomonas syringae TaxID=317 RepID=UPI001012E8B3|nr:HK97 family phage prohead protease [Pseudomonas syringae]MBI6558122.1 HK97 family phage prohead protease [Pseudomonas syringae]MBI6569169.1 HK97 family phage prohead protease [Pseudomonas syringae]MBI6585170.1 HK97 family phage prohead protease [Pseudomonas syringae]MBI6595726.1 HK97 family phage prohead protease [Pseudomonas syringae]MDC6494326.1 HK97 family phage prohead protease [Pseudomonas syringae]